MRNIEIRLEQREDYRAVEELTREAFWNLYTPGCDEHLLIHNLRKSPAFLPELSFVALLDGRLAAHIAYTKSRVVDRLNNTHDTITFGPLSVLPVLQRQGLGSALVEYSMAAARKLGHSAVIIYGSPDYYSRFGFKSGKAFGISRPDGKFPRALQVLELREGALGGIEGRFYESPDSEVDPKEAERFEETFPYKEKLVTDTQREFQIISNSFE